MGPHGLVALGKRAAHDAAELLEGGIGDPVAGEEAVAPARDEALLEEQGQVLARIGLRGPGERAQSLDAPLFLASSSTRNARRSSSQYRYGYLSTNQSSQRVKDFRRTRLSSR